MFDESVDCEEAPPDERANDEKPLFRVGCAGHRDPYRFVGFDEQKSREAMRAYFSEKCNDFTVKLYCGMSDGADTLFAEEALACGVQLVAVLPCPWREYAAAHADGGRFIGLLDRASEVIIVAGNDRRYANVMDSILQNSDEIVALWYGADIRLFDDDGNRINRGGTYDMLVRAKLGGKNVALFN